MTISYLPYAPGQQMLLPAALQDWLPEGHPAHRAGKAMLQQARKGL